MTRGAASQVLKRLGAEMRAMEDRLSRRLFRTWLTVNIATILATVALSFAAARLGWLRV